MQNSAHRNGWLLSLMLMACGHSAAPRNAASGEASTPTGRPSAVRAIDWATRSYSVTLMEGEGELPFAVVNRAYQADLGNGNVERLKISAPIFADLTGDGEEEAIMRFDYQPGDRGDEGFDTLFVFSAEKPSPLGRVEGGKLDGHGSIAAFVVEPIVGPVAAGQPRNRLIVTRRNIDEPITAPLLDTYVWDGHFFAQVAAAR